MRLTATAAAPRAVSLPALHAFLPTCVAGNLANSAGAGRAAPSKLRAATDTARTALAARAAAGRAPVIARAAMRRTVSIAYALRARCLEERQSQLLKGNGLQSGSFILD
jgi:hypothetical protein